MYVCMDAYVVYVCACHCNTGVCVCVCVCVCIRVCVFRIAQTVKRCMLTTHQDETQ